MVVTNGGAVKKTRRDNARIGAAEMRNVLIQHEFKVRTRQDISNVDKFVRVGLAISRLRQLIVR